MRVVEVSQAGCEEGTGMGRVCQAWRIAFEARGHKFEHVGPETVGSVAHPSLFPRAARRWVDRNLPEPGVYLVHEPCGGSFTDRKPVFIFSHGLEHRAWEIGLRWSGASGEHIAARSRLLYPIWRLWPCDRGLRKATHVFVLNREDRAACLTKYRRTEAEVSILSNGYRPDLVPDEAEDIPNATLLFVGTWLSRKGIRVLSEAAERLHQRRPEASWILAGTGVEPALVLRGWPEAMRGVTTVVPRFDLAGERELYRHRPIFVLPSFFEGQPLALLQAMACGCPCVTTNCCGQRDLIVDGENGFLVERGDPGALATRLEQLLENPELRARLGGAARRAVAGRTWEAVGRELVERIEALVGRGAAA